MNGIDILNKEEILVAPEWILTAFLISIIILVVSIGFSCLFNELVMDIPLNICASLVFLSGISAVVFLFCYLLLEIEPTGRYRYEVTIDDSVSITEVYDHYNIIEQRGDIWVLEDKED